MRPCSYEDSDHTEQLKAAMEGFLYTLDECCLDTQEREAIIHQMTRVVKGTISFTLREIESKVK